MALNRARWPYIHPELLLTALPFEVYQDISNLIDLRCALNDAFMQLGQRLGYSVRQCRIIEARVQGSCQFNGSRTQALLEDYAGRRGVVSVLQGALESMDHQAADVIPSYLMSSSRLRYASVEETSDPSICQCAGCQNNGIPFRVPPYSQTRLAPGPPCYPTPPPPTVGSPHNDFPSPPRPTFYPPNPLPDDPGSQIEDRIQRISGTAYIQQQGNVQPIDQHQNNFPRVPVDQQNVASIPGTRSQHNQGDQRNVRHQAPASVAPQQRGEARIGPMGSSTPCLPNEPPYLGDLTYSDIGSSQDRRTSCACEKCRVSSNPDETLLLRTVTTLPFSDCRLQLHPRERDTNYEASSVHRDPQTDHGLNSEQQIAAQNLSRDQPEDNSEFPLQNRRSWPCEEPEPIRMSGSSSDGSIARVRRSPHIQRIHEIELVYKRTSFNNVGEVGARKVSNEHNETGPNDDAATDELIEGFEQLNARNESGWNASSSSNNQSHPTGGNNSGVRQRQPESDGANRDFVFVTFSFNPNRDDESHLEEIVQLCRMLKNAGIRVKIDMDPETFQQLRLNKQDWLDKMAREAKYVIVCLSPAYYQDTQHIDDNTQPQPDMVQLNARYIFDILRSEYHWNGARNRRFIPVMFTNSGATEAHIPQCMRSTLVYNYPNQVEDIIGAITGRENGEYRIPYPR